LPKLSAVIASHDHYDHYDIDSFSTYPDKAVPFIVKRGMAAKARQAGRIFLKYDGTPERFQRAVARHAPATNVRVLAPGEPLTLGS
jgi:metal-dependent hydrolase (beta-lactamase superfamily II)